MLRSRASSAKPVNDGLGFTEPKSVVSEEMLLHSVDEAAIGADRASAFGAFEVEMVAVVARVSVDGAFAGVADES